MEISQKWLVRLSFGLFIGWTMSFPYEGPLLYALAEFLDFDGVLFNTISVGLVSGGMLSAAFFVNRWKFGKMVMTFSALTSIVGSAVIMFLPNNLIFYDLLILAYLSGLFVPAWGIFFFHNTPVIERGKAVADVLIIGNIVLTISSVLSIWFIPLVGMLYCVLLLLGTFFLTSKMLIQIELDNGNSTPQRMPSSSDFQKSFLVFLAFIFLISVTAGVMFSVVYPYFSSFELVASLYTNFPYIIALLILRRMPPSINKNFTISVGMSILGLSYILFAFMPAGLLKFFLVMTPMLAAYGTFDYFWWCIMGDLCAFMYTPSFIIGISLATNILGVFSGGLMTIIAMKGFGIESLNMSFFALTVVFVIIALMPVMNQQMSRLLSRHIFFIQYEALPIIAKEAILEERCALSLLTERESEVVDLILRGMTSKKIGETLFISDNTVKTHSKNIYKKLNINTKYELIKYFSPL